jgi:hypothetical protein
MFLIDVLGFEYDDATEPFVLTPDEAHYTHSASRKIYSRASIDALMPAPRVTPPVVEEDDE